MTKEEALDLAGFWARHGFAIEWTAGKSGPDAKAVKASWDKSAKVIANTEAAIGLAAGKVAHNLERKNPVVVSVASGMLLVDADSVDSDKRFKRFKPPKTLSASSTPSQGKRHYYYRPDEGMPPGVIEFTAGGKVVAKDNGYLVAPPALHPDGHHYEWVNDLDIATLPRDVHQAMLDEAGEQRRELKADADHQQPVKAGDRHELLKIEAGRLARVKSLDDEGVYDSLMRINLQRCMPPKPADEVRRLAEAAVTKWRKRDDARDGVVTDPGTGGGGERRPSEGHDFSGVTRVSDHQSRHIPWLDKPFLQAAAFQILAARGSTGKGLWTAQLAAQLTRGMLPGQDGPTNVAFISSEDSVSQDVKPRLQVAEADVERAFVVTNQFLLPRDTDWLRGLIRHLELGAVIIDPVANHIGGVDGNDESAIREALAGLQAVADEENCLVLGVRHMRKDSDSGALAAVLGSTAWVDLPRNVIIMVRDPEDSSIVYQDVHKQNRAKMGDTGRVYQIDGVDIVLDDGVEDNVGRMRLALDIEFKDLDSIVGKKKNTARKAIQDTIIALLREAPGMEMPANELDSMVVARIGCAEGTARNARSAITAEYGKEATEERPLVTIKPKQSETDQRYRVKLDWKTQLEDIDEW